VLLFWASSPAATAVPVEAYGNLPSIEQIALSPNGKLLAFIQTRLERRMLAVIDVDDSKTVGLLDVGDAKLRSIAWADDTRLLLINAWNGMPLGLVGTRTEWNLMAVYEVPTSKIRTLLGRVRADEHTMNVVVNRPIVVRNDKGTLLYATGLYVQDKTKLALFRINLDTGDEALVRKGDGATIGWVLDDAGDVVAENDYYESNKRWAIKLFDHGHLRQTVDGIASIDIPDILGLSSDAEAVIVSAPRSDGSVWKPLSLKDGTWGADLAPNERRTGVVLNEGSARIIGTSYIGDRNSYHFVDPELQAGWQWIERVFGYQRVSFVASSSDHSKLIVEVMGPKAGYGYYLANTKEHFTLPIGNIYAGVQEIAEVRPIHYPANDGLDIPAYLTLPPGREPKKLPLIVFPHGGPQARDMLDFDWWAQAMAAQGYAVLQPNYRGSSLDQHWIEAGYGEWGRKMQTDLSDGVNYLVSQGIVDAGRVCIVGASYGGYAALAGVALQSGIYRCAVAVSGVSDPRSMLNWVARKEMSGDQIGLRYWQRFLGVTEAGDSRLDAISPMKHAADISVPLMLIHGKEDITVPYEQSTDLMKALKHAGKSAEFITLDKEDHYLSRSATRLQMLKSLVEFIKRNNPPD
jgi:dipeptidyl aminopeptidase/acylaminoacyl peptidase